MLDEISLRDQTWTSTPRMETGGNATRDELVEQMLLIVGSQTEFAVPRGVHEITRDDIRNIYDTTGGDPSAVYDEVMSLLMIRSLHLEDEHRRTSVGRCEDTKLQWRELCHGLGLDECHDFFKALEDLPEDERDAALSENGGFFQSLLLQLEEEERAAQEESDRREAMALGGMFENEVDNEQHPLEKLQRMFPEYKLNVIEDVFEAHGYDVEATASALCNIEAVSHVKSFATIVKAKTPVTAWAPQRANPHANNSSLSNTYSYEATPPVESLGHFPVLPATRSKQRKHRNGGGQYTTLEELSIVAKVPNARQRLKKRVSLKSSAPNAWNTLASPRHGGNVAMETKLTTDLKLQRLYGLLPTIDRELIRSTFFLNNSSSTATEAALREIFHLPMPEHDPGPPTPEEEDSRPVVTADDVQADPTYSECRARVDNCWHELSSRYVAALQSFNRNHHVITSDRVAAVSAGRRALREAQHEAAHAFVKAHMPHIRHQQAIDLHGLTVVEAIRVAREVIDVCRAERIRRCILICGVGNHSINQKARIITAIQLSLEHRRIAFRRESGTLFIYPLRSTNS